MKNIHVRISPHPESESLDKYDKIRSLPCLMIRPQKSSHRFSKTIFCNLLIPASAVVLRRISDRLRCHVTISPPSPQERSSPKRKELPRSRQKKGRKLS
ncbi:hypothetical protein AVEN_226750-1 [Araneus ventricosus]|uniref:Uncharacterized protein n=1 Tax=Araneus ventricosus TaxID=182803 RepID=A0A4Y2GDY9_ARAVE|nr:hypothetical protein AVEN_226750-1 [Araneus ventricosus]